MDAAAERGDPPEEDGEQRRSCGVPGKVTHETANTVVDLVEIARGQIEFIAREDVGAAERERIARGADALLAAAISRTRKLQDAGASHDRNIP